MTSASGTRAAPSLPQRAVQSRLCFDDAGSLVSSSGCDAHDG